MKNSLKPVLKAACSGSLMALALCAPPAMAQLPTGDPLSGLERLKNFETRRASSSDENWKNGNGDCRAIAPGGTLTIAELTGPGVITHFWNTVSHPAPNYSALMTLRIYWDGEAHPSIECPLGDFFGIGMGVDKSFSSLPIRVTSEGRARNCYWPMPFRKSARITISNESDQPCQGFFFYVDWQKHHSLPQDTAYFHAMYRQEFPCEMGRNYLLADIAGRGHYVGAIQSVYHTSNGWYGEGDDFFFIDGEREPSLRGTGSEDYFCDAWGFHQQDGPFYGTPLWEAAANTANAGDRSSAYRFHIPDPIVFEKSLHAEIEHKGAQFFSDGKVDGFIERDDLMSSVAFWYQTEPHKPWPALPAGANRLPFHNQTLVAGWKVASTARHSEHPMILQPIGGATDGRQILLMPGDDKGWIEIPFTVEREITSELVGRLFASWDYGTYRALLDGQEIARNELYAASPTLNTHPWGLHKLAPGEHILRLECVGKPDKSKGYFLGFDALTARVPAYVRPEGFDLRNIRKP